MSTTPLAAIQEAVYDLLTGDATLTGLADIYDEVPEGAAKPYVVIGEAVETPENWHGGFGRSTVITLHVWSDYAGFSEANGIANRLMELLDHQPLTVTGHTVVSVRYEFSQTLQDPDPDIRHVPVRFRITTEQS